MAKVNVQTDPDYKQIFTNCIYVMERMLESERKHWKQLMSYPKLFRVPEFIERTELSINNIETRIKEYKTYINENYPD